MGDFARKNHLLASFSGEGRDFLLQAGATDWLHLLLWGLGIAHGRHLPLGAAEEVLGVLLVQILGENSQKIWFLESEGGEE